MKTHVINQSVQVVFEKMSGLIRLISKSYRKYIIKYGHTCESNLLAAYGAPILFLLVLAGVLVVRVRVRRARARSAGARSALLFQFL